MSSEFLTVIALIRAKPGSEAALREILLSVLGPTRAEAGCVNYDLHESTENPGAFAFHENWRSKADLDAHLASPHVSAALAKAGPLLATPPQILLWKKIG